MAKLYSDQNMAGSWILEQLSLQIPSIEMAVARRAWHEAVSASPGQERDLWWKWLSEATQSIGMQSKTIDCSTAEAVELIKNGAQVITCGGGEEAIWLGARGFRHGRANVMQIHRNGQTMLMKLRQLRRLLTGFSVDGRLRCVVIRGDLSSIPGEIHGMAPLARLLGLLRPEWSDVWIVTVFAFIVGLLALATPIAVELLVNTVAFGRFIQPVAVLSMILLIFLSFSAAMRALQTYVSELVQRRLFVRVAGDLAFRLPRVRVEATDGVYLPELTNRFFDVVTVQKVLAQFLLDGVGLILTTFIGMGVLAFYHPWLLGFDVVMLACLTFIILVLGRGGVYSAMKESKNKYYTASWLEDIARCQTAFRSSGGNELALERTDRLLHEYLEARQKHFGILMRQILFALGLQAVSSTALLGIGGWLVIDGQLTLGQLVAAELIVTVIVGGFAKLGKQMESFYDLLASVDKLGVLFDLPVERFDGIQDMPTDGPASVSAAAVTYHKPGGGCLPGSVSLLVPPGGTLAILGRSGSGKSTLLDLIYGLRPPAGGHIKINGVNPQDLRSDILREQVALVRPSEIFHGSLEENVHLHRSHVTSGDVRRALEELGLYDEVLQLNGGFETHLDGAGSPLSSVQQDLLCLARSIAGRPRLILIDSLLDRLPDEDLEQAMNCLLQQDRSWSLIIATGRKAIASRCDETLLLGSESTSAAGEETSGKSDGEVKQ